MQYLRESHLPYPQPWEWVKDNIIFNDVIFQSSICNYSHFDKINDFYLT